MAGSGVCGPREEGHGNMIQQLCALVLLLTAATAAGAAERSAGPPPGYVKNLACRVVTRATEPGSPVSLLVESSLDTTSGRPVDHSFDTPLHDGRVLTAQVRHVYVRMPRERFNVAMLLDGKPHLKLNHIDLDIYVETAVDGRIYALHCFGDIQ